MGLRLAGLVFYHVEDSGVNAMVEGHMQIRFVLLSFLCLYRSNAINDFGNLNTCNFLCLAWLLRLCTIILLYLIVLKISLGRHHFIDYCWEEPLLVYDGLELVDQDMLLTS